MNLRRTVLLALLCSTLLSMAAVPWPPSLYLGNSGYWPERVAVTITNRSSTPVIGEPLGLALPGLAGARVESLRVTRADGVELLFELLDARKLSKPTGSLASDDRLLVPVECPAGSAATLLVYAGNAEAWAVPDFLPSKWVGRVLDPDRAGLGVTVGPVERFQIRPPSGLRIRQGRDWRNRAEVRVRHFDEQANSTALVRVNLRQALARLPGVGLDSEARVASSDGTDLASYMLGQGSVLLFPARLPPGSEELFQIPETIGWAGTRRKSESNRARSIF